MLIQFFNLETNKSDGTHLKNGTILLASFSAVLNPWEYSITWAMSWRSGDVIARLRKSFFRLSGKLDRPAYPGFIVMNIAMSGLTLTCFPTSSTEIMDDAGQTQFIMTSTPAWDSYIHHSTDLQSIVKNHLLEMFSSEAVSIVTVRPWWNTL